ncbi:CD3337/EF1877 family mobilome membrane protein [Alkalihalobacillus sp. TS-13]|uniref:CD3337/EF1877 family mobilome membrane protein n=1 Tax=Alkalihalobacillus sp. TS-13 TaxID=2842455 RepID=UPI001C8834FE|nr:hypothetical protein [Alkalihalobacillus sp. TS-13]
MSKKTFVSLILLFVLLIPATTGFALDDQDRSSKKYNENRYELMTYSDDSWYDFMGQTGTEMVDFLKNALWSLNRSLSFMVLMVVYQLFSLDIVDLTKSSVKAITSSTAGTLTYNLGLFALSLASIGIVVRAYIQQNWQAFLKLLSLILLSLSLLFSIQSEKFNYIDLAHGVSTTLENVIMEANPSLSQDGAFEFTNFDDNTARDVSIAIENKVFDALVYKPYLLLQYGKSDETKIKAEASDRIDEYLNANPATEEGAEKRKEIEENEFKQYNNQTIFAGNAYKQMGYIMIMMISTIIQGIVYFFIALIRIMLQFAFIVMMLLFPIILFMSLFPSFEALTARYTRGTFILIVFKGITMFFVLVSTSFITLGYSMTNMNDDIYYRMFIQIIFSVAILFLYMKRQFVFNMLEGASPNLGDTGAGEGMMRRSVQGGRGMLLRRRMNRVYKRMNKGRPNNSNNTKDKSGNFNGTGTYSGRSGSIPASYKYGEGAKSNLTDKGNGHKQKDATNGTDSTQKDRQVSERSAGQKEAAASKASNDNSGRNPYKRKSRPNSLNKPQDREHAEGKSQKNTKSSGRNPYQKTTDGSSNQYRSKRRPNNVANQSSNNRSSRKPKRRPNTLDKPLKNESS